MSRGRVSLSMDRNGTRALDDERTSRGVGGGGEEADIAEGASYEEGAQEVVIVLDETPKTIQAAHATLQQQARSRSRGREPIIPTGRGGRGNLRSPSRSPAEALAFKEEQELERRVEERVRREVRERGGVVMGGRGGVGNVRRD